MKFYAVGGFSEVGKNCSAVEIGNEIVLMDMGYQMDKIVALDEEDRDITPKQLRDIGAIPNDTILDRKKVQAIVISHGHLDHIGAVPHMMENYKCPLITTPFAMSLLKKALADAGKRHLFKFLYTLPIGKRAKISPNFTLEFVNITHSIPDTALVVLHTKEGAVVYANDFKLDNTPVLGDKPDYTRMKQIAKEGVKLLICESLYAGSPSRTPSESIAKQLVKETIKKTYDSGGAVAISCFSSHIARIHGILEANHHKRKVVFLGRAMETYLKSAMDLGYIDIGKAQVWGRRKIIAKNIKEIAKNPQDYLIVCTGNQGEPNAVLSRLSRDEFAFKFGKDDNVIFSSQTIPSPINIANVDMLKERLHHRGVRTVTGIHVSGHASGEDHRDFLRILQPQYVIPSHGELQMLTSYASMAVEEGYTLGDTVKIVQDGSSVEIR